MIDNAESLAARLVELLALDRVVPLGVNATLFEDWALDSLQAFQMILVIESLAGVEIPPMEIPNIFTVGDAYQYYRSLFG